VSDSLRASGKLSAAILASRVLGLAREVVFAALFGAGAIADAYAVAFRIPNLLRDLFAEGALSSAFVPTFTSAMRQDGEARAHVLGHLTMSCILVVTGTLAALGLVFAEPIVLAFSAGFAGDADKVALATRLTRVMMPVFALVSLGAVWMGMLNAQRRFVVPAVAPALFNVASIGTGAVVWVVGGELEYGVLIWSVGTVVAGAIQAFVQLFALWRLGYRPRLRLAGAFRDPGVRRIARLMAPAVLGVAAVQLSVFVNTRFASSLGDGPVAQLNYAFRLFFLPLGMFGVALATVTTTSVSEAAADGDRPQLLQRAAESVSAAWLLVSASAVGLFVLAEPMITMIYRHGQTTAADAAAIAVVLQAFVVGLLPYSLVKILAPTFYTIDRPRIPLLASAIGVSVNVTFNALTYRELGAPGIALGTSLGAIANLVVLRLAFRRVVGQLPRPRWLRNLAALAVANLAMAVVVWAAWEGVEHGLATLSLGRPLAFITMVMALGVVVGIGFVVFVGLCRTFGYPAADALWRMPMAIARKLRGRRPG
jgi:putative peptidoglycan lipid II flippase